VVVNVVATPYIRADTAKTITYLPAWGGESNRLYNTISGVAGGRVSFSAADLNIKFQVVFDSLLYFSLLDSNVSLRDCGAAMLQEMLD